MPQRPHALRTLRLWVLAWFVLALGAAAASPLLAPRTLERVCAGNGTVRLVVRDADGAVLNGSAGMDCPLCLTADAPPPAGATARQPLAPPTCSPTSFTPWPAAHHTVLAPPARAPPFVN